MMRIILTFAVALMALTVLGAKAGDDDVESGTTGTGIMGVITGLGSIHVNGLRIEVPAGLTVRSSLGTRSADSLEVGETVVVEAALTDGVVSAQHIRTYYPIIAPVDATRLGRVSVLGLDLDVSGVDTPDLAPGDWVAVSGLWRGATVEVSNIRPIPPRSEIVINGTYSQSADGVQRVGPFALGRRYVAHAEPGDHLRVTGAWSSGPATLSPTRIEAGLFSRTLETLLIEGYMSRPDRRGAYSIYGSGIVVYTDDPSMQVPQERSVFCVDQSGDTSITQHLDLDMEPAARVRLLEMLARRSDGAVDLSRRCSGLP